MLIYLMKDYHAHLQSRRKLTFSTKIRRNKTKEVKISFVSNFNDLHLLRQTFLHSKRWKKFRSSFRPKSFERSHDLEIEIKIEIEIEIEIEIKYKRQKLLLWVNIYYLHCAHSAKIKLHLSKLGFCPLKECLRIFW
jgi:hypothetical protein